MYKNRQKIKKKSKASLILFSLKTKRRRRSLVWKRGQIQGQKEYRITITQSEGTRIRALFPLRRLISPVIYVFPTTLLIRVQCFRKDLYKAIQGPNTRPVILSMITGSYFPRRVCLTIFESLDWYTILNRFE